VKKTRPTTHHVMHAKEKASRLIPFLKKRRSAILARAKAE